MPIEQDEEIRKILKESRTIAVVGASPKPWRDSGSIARFLMDRGYRVYPVNPKYQDVLGVPCHPDLASLPEPIDIVDVFRDPAEIGEVVTQAIAARAGTLWLQLGVVNASEAERAEQAGMRVVMDRCIAVDHRRLIM